ncbi:MULTISPECIES: hypothetical protein [Haloarcula]|uniref:hypothetical protein n=1 Tax=Haloarcula TaxID=2237 RepID=UPI0023E75EFB|nr:hypothetical protein [Halomicroarcula sp. SHR3]
MSRFKEYGRTERSGSGNEKYIVVSGEFTDETQEELEYIRLQPFVDETTPSRNGGIQLEPESALDIMKGIETTLVKESDLY